MENGDMHTKEFNIIFEKLEEAKEEQLENNGLTESDYSNIDESIQKLQEIQQSIDTSSYTYFTRT
jgi:hypothetical protein